MNEIEVFKMLVNGLAGCALIGLIFAIFVGTSKKS